MRDTTVIHRFYEFVITATWHGYTVTEYQHEQDAIDATRSDPRYVTDWHTFRLQAPCQMPRQVDEAIIAYYEVVYGMLSS
jgi:hypothetical protein